MVNFFWVKPPSPTDGLTSAQPEIEIDPDTPDIQCNVTPDDLPPDAPVAPVETPDAVEETPPPKPKKKKKTVVIEQSSSESDMRSTQSARQHPTPSSIQ